MKNKTKEIKATNDDLPVKAGQRVACPECTGRGYTIVGGESFNFSAVQAGVKIDTGPRRPVVCRGCHGERTATIGQVK